MNFFGVNGLFIINYENVFDFQRYGLIIQKLKNSVKHMLCGDLLSYRKIHGKKLRLRKSWAFIESLDELHSLAEIYCNKL